MDGWYPSLAEVLLSRQQGPLLFFAAMMLSFSDAFSHYGSSLGLNKATGYDGQGMHNEVSLFPAQPILNTVSPA